MKRSILSIIVLALIISLTITVGFTNLVTVYAIENYLQLRSANVDYHGGDINVDIRTGGNIPSEKGNNGFGYAVLTDVGDESVDNALVIISDIGIKNDDKSAKNDKLHTYVLDLKGDISSACSGSDYEVAKSSSDNKAFDTSYPIDVEGNKIAIDDVDTNDLASDTVKAISSFTAEAITNNGKIKQICIDIEDVLKQSEINTSYDSNDDSNGNGNDEDNDVDKRRDNRGQDECDIGDNGFPFCDGRDDGEDSTNDDEDECNIGDNGFPFCDGRDQEEDQEEEEDSSGIDINQSIEQSNGCDGEASCSNEGSNEADVDYSSAADDEDFDFGSDVDISQSIEQSNTCSGEVTCSNFASNVANIS